MNHPSHFKPLTFVALLFLLISLSPELRSQSRARPEAPKQETTAIVRTISGSIPGNRVSEFIGQTVRGSRGEELGTIRDLVVDAYSGRDPFAVIATPSDNRLRLLPLQAIAADTATKGLKARITAEELARVPIVGNHEFETRKLAVSSALYRAVIGKFDPGATSGGANNGTHLVRLDALRGKRVTTGVDRVGTVNDVVVATDQPAAAIVTPEKDFQMAGRQFVVPLTALNLIATAPDPITTQLTRGDFERAPGLDGAAKVTQRPLRR